MKKSLLYALLGFFSSTWLFGNASVFSKSPLLSDSLEIQKRFPSYANPQPNRRNTEADTWADSILATLSLEQKIGQLFMVTTYSNKDENHSLRIERLINEYGIGGLIFIERGDPATQASLTNRYQAYTRVPLLVGFDAEWGLGMRLPSVIDLPKPMTVGAMKDAHLAYLMGVEMAKQCRRVGVHMNFAPSVDVNSNPDNPIIGVRSFGESRENVSEKGIAYVKGMQHNGVIACAKHFPGHGDTREDSHRHLPVIAHGSDRLHNVELYPFRQLIADSVMSIITGHLLVPYYDNKAASISKKLITNLLKEDMGFQGLVVTDALNMRGITKITAPGQLDLEAFLAGNDILLMSENVIEGIRRIKIAIETGQVEMADLEHRVRKVLKAKHFVGLHRSRMVEVMGIHQGLNNADAQQLKKNIFENAITLVKNDHEALPFALTDTTRYVSVAIGANYNNVFQQSIGQYVPGCQYFATASRTDENYLNELLPLIDSTKTVIISLHQTERSQTPRQNFGITATQRNFISRLHARNRVAVVVFGSPYSLKYFTDVPALLCAYENDDAAQKATADILFGQIPAKGELPVSITEKYSFGFGISTDTGTRLSKGTPESVDMNSQKLNEIDRIVQQSIENQVFPGCQVLVARRGKVVFSKNYGAMAYNTPNEKVNDQSVYDLASVTKVAATLQALMLLYDRQQIDLAQKASYYLPELKGTNKENIILQHLLTHQAGLVAYVPFWERTRLLNGFNAAYYRIVKNDTFNLQVADNLWATPAIRDSVWRWVIKTPLAVARKDREGSYPFLYSDLGLMMLQKVIERMAKEPLDSFVMREFYKPLGLKTTGYNPMQRGILKNDIATTEEDRFFRMNRLKGTVQDQQAAMLGGVAGHAGLFSNATDLATLMQMNLQAGLYANKQYLKANTLALFAQRQSPKNHRGLGWDKLPDDKESNYISAKTSANAYGHSGYTGTLVWNDPDRELVFVFLSNRVNPNTSNNKINSLKIRRKVMDLVYEAIQK